MLFVVGGQNFHTCSLLMIALSFAKLPFHIVIPYNVSSKCIRRHLVSNLIMQKLLCFFSTKTSREVQEEIKVRFGAQVIEQHEKYLELPSLMGRNKKASFSDIKDKLSKKLAGWKGKLLSKAAKEALIKAVAQVIPTYTMSCFKISDSLCDNLTSMIR